MPLQNAEIEGLAAGAAQPDWLLYALNARSEILNNVKVAECTSLIDTRRRILAQNWDWGRALEERVVLLRVRGENGGDIATLTEAGILGKVGMNSAGLGVCLNILSYPGRLDGLPVHVFLRAVLERDNVTAVRALLAGYGPGKASHLLVADATGDSLSVEFAGKRWFELQPRDGFLCHSNHYLADDALNRGELFYSTRERQHRAEQSLAGGGETWALLGNRDDGPLSVCRPYAPAETPGFGEVGTVFSLERALAEGELRIRRGCDPAQADYRARV